MNIDLYCINLQSSKERKERMVNRFHYHNLDNNVTFIDAISRDDQIVDFYGEGSGRSLDERIYRSEIACFLSHLKAIRTFLETSDKTAAIICEDDILLYNRFMERYVDIFDKIKPILNAAPLISLSYIICFWDEFKTHEQYNFLRHINPNHMWGTQMYWISRAYAKEALVKYDKPFRYLSGFRSAEMIVKYCPGYVLVPPLAIEEVVDSEIRSKADLGLHYASFEKWNYDNYSNSEKKHLSPLVNSKFTGFISTDSLIDTCIGNRNQGDYLEAYKYAKQAQLQNSSDLRTYREISIIAYYIGLNREGLLCCEHILRNPHASKELLTQTRNNLKFYLPILQGKYIDCVTEMIQSRSFSIYQGLDEIKGELSLTYDKSCYRFHFNDDYYALPCKFKDAIDSTDLFCHDENVYIKTHSGIYILESKVIRNLFYIK